MALKKYWRDYHPKYNQETVILEIKKFVQRNGRIPLKREVNCLYHPARKYFGTWNNAIKIAGYIPNPVLFASHFTAIDGHNCDSLAEKIIDDFLYSRAIKHQRNVHYPEGSYTADFKIGDIYVEFFGLVGAVVERYDRNKSIKQKLARKYKLKVIDIYPRDIFKKGGLEKILGIFRKTGYVFGSRKEE